MMKKNGAACDYRCHPGDSAEEKIKRNLPRPDWRFDYGLAVVTGFTRNRPTGNIHTFARNDAVLPCLLAQLLESFLVRSLVCHTHVWGAHASRVLVAVSRRNA